MELEETPRAKRPKVVVASAGGEQSRMAAVSRLTVWCKSLVFHGEGYAVFDDADGRMVFRVDNYAGRGSMALMDHAGRVLLTVRRRHRKMLSLVEKWEVYKGDADASNGQDAAHLMMRATKDLGNPSCSVAAAAGDEPGGGLYRMSWSRWEEWSRIHWSGSAADDSLVAEVRRKRGGPKQATLLGKDVLSLVVQPGMDQAVAMAMLMISNSYR